MSDSFKETEYTFSINNDYDIYSLDTSEIVKISILQQNTGVTYELKKSSNYWLINSNTIKTKKHENMQMKQSGRIKLALCFIKATQVIQSRAVSDSLFVFCSLINITDGRINIM